MPVAPVAQYESHPLRYEETGSGQKTFWNIPLGYSQVAVIGGYVVDGISGGVYKAVAGPASLTVSVTDGFYSIVTKESGQVEFCSRLAQARQHGWAHGTEHPLPDWLQCR
jgi:hypothetical protein